MRWTLFSVTCRCAWRRLRPALEQNPLLVLAAGAACVAIPVAAVVAGVRLDAQYAELARDDAALRALALGLGATGLVGGAAVALLAPGAAQLGRALEGAPITRVDAAWALTIAPACAGGVVLLGPFLLFATVMAGVNGIVLAAAAATAVLTGAALGEGLRRCGRPELSGLAVVAAAAGLWAIGGSALGGEWYEGPTGVMAGAHPPQVSLTLLATLALAGAALWLAACAMPSATGERRREVRATRLPVRMLPAVAIAVARRIARHHQLRAQAAAAVLVPVAVAASVGEMLDVGGAPLLAFAVGLSMTAAALLPAAAVGLGSDSRWLFDAAPRPARVVAVAVALGGVGVSLMVVGAAALLVAPFARGDPSAYLELEGAAAFVFGCAALGGAIVPWRTDGLLQQLASYASVVAVLVCAWIVVGRLEGAVGLEGTTFTVAVGNVVLALGVTAAGAIAR